MKPLALAAALAGLLSAVVPAPVSAQKGKDDEFTLAIASPKAGEKVKVTVSEDVETKITTYLVGKNDVQTEYRTKKFVYEDEILGGQAASRLPTQVRRKYESTNVYTGPEKGGSGNRGVTDLQQKTIEIAQSGPTYTFKVAGGKPLTEKDNKEAHDILKAEFGHGPVDLRDHMLPKHKLKEKDEWNLGEGKPGPVAVAKELSKSPNDLVLGELGATISGKLVDVARPKKEDKDKPLMGKLEVTFTAPVSQFAKDKGFMAEQGTYTVKLVGDGCIDGKSPAGHLKTEMKLKVTGTVDGFKMDVEITATEDRKTELVPKDPPKK